MKMMVKKVLYILVQTDALIFIYLYSNFIFYYEIAAWNGHTATCQFLIDKGIDVNVKDKYGLTPLQFGEYKLNN
jgi:ankyrin repeat protein